MLYLPPTRDPRLYSGGEGLCNVWLLVLVLEPRLYFHLWCCGARPVVLVPAHRVTCHAAQPCVSVYSIYSIYQGFHTSIFANQALNQLIST